MSARGSRGGRRRGAGAARLAAVALVALAAPSPAGAQASGPRGALAPAGLPLDRPGATAAGSGEAFLTPHATWGLGERASLTFQALWGQGSGTQLGAGAGSLVALDAGGLRLLELGGTARRWDGGFMAGHRNALDVRAGLRGERLGASAAGSWSGYRIGAESGAAAGLLATAWMRVAESRLLTLSIARTRGSSHLEWSQDTVITILGKYHYRTTRRATGIGDFDFTDAELRVDVPVSRVAAALVVGTRLDGSEGRGAWMRATLGVPLAERLALVATGGLQPDRPDLRSPEGAFVRLGLQIDVGAADRPRPVLPLPAPDGPLAVVTAPDGSQVLVFRSVSALRAEVRGDFSDWQPRALEPTPDGGWQIPWTAGAGTFRINIRLDDGPWIAPPGLPSFADEFGGMVGILVVPEG